MPSRLPDLESLALLVAVAEAGSLARAAAATGITQPSASVRIAGLERRLGVTLLVRDNRGSRLTPEGRLVVGWAERVLAAAHELVDGVSLLQSRRGASLAVAASLTVAESLLPGLLVRLRQDQPATAVALQVVNSRQVITLVRDGGVPVGFIESTRVPADLASAVVGTDRLVVVVAPAHAWARRRRPLGVAELLATPLVLREEGSGTRETLESRLARHGRLAPPALELSTSSSIRTAVLGGAAPAVLSELTVRADLDAGSLVEVEVVGLSLDRRLTAVWRRGRPPTGAAHALVSLARRDARRRGTSTR